MCGEEVCGASSRELELVTLLAPQTLPHQGVPRLATKKENYGIIKLKKDKKGKLW